MSKKYTGIEIGSRQVKMTQCSDNSIYKAAVEPLPDNYVSGGRIVSLEAMAVFLKAMAKKHRFTDKSCAVVLPDSQAFARRLTMPAMTVEHLNMNLPYEFHDFINGNKEKYVFDYCMLEMQNGEDNKPAAMDLMAAAAPKALIEDYKEMMKLAGFKLEIAAPEVFAYSNLIREYEDVQEEKGLREYGFVDFGYRSTKLHIFSGFRFEVTREIEYGCRNLVRVIEEERHVDRHIASSYLRENYMDCWSLPGCRDIYDAIGVELMRAVNFYGFNNPDSHLETVYYCGGGSRITPLTEAVSGHISLEVKPVTDLLALVDGVDEEVCISPAAAGITYQ